MWPADNDFDTTATFDAKRVVTDTAPQAARRLLRDEGQCYLHGDWLRLLPLKTPPPLPAHPQNDSLA